MKGRILIALSLLMLLLASCAKYNIISPPAAIHLKPQDYSTEQLLPADFDRTWNAVLDTLESYPLNIVEKESGIVVTDWVDEASQDYIYKFQDPGPPYFYNEELIAAEYRQMDGQALKARYRITIRIARREQGTLVRVYNREMLLKERYLSPQWPKQLLLLKSSYLRLFLFPYPSQKIYEEIPIKSSTIRERQLIYKIGKALGIELEQPAAPVYDEDHYYFNKEAE